MTASSFTVIQGEEWLEAPYPYDRYMISTLGRCYNAKTRNLISQGMYSRDGRPAVASFSLQTVRWASDNLSPEADRQAPRKTHSTGRWVRVGVIVWRTFVGPVGTGYTVARIERDDHPYPWRLENLQLISGRWTEGEP